MLRPDSKRTVRARAPRGGRTADMGAWTGTPGARALRVGRHARSRILAALGALLCRGAARRGAQLLRRQRHLRLDRARRRGLDRRGGRQPRDGLAAARDPRRLARHADQLPRRRRHDGRERERRRLAQRRPPGASAGLLDRHRGELHPRQAVRSRASASPCMRSRAPAVGLPTKRSPPPSRSPTRRASARCSSRPTPVTRTPCSTTSRRPN